MIAVLHVTIVKKLKACLYLNKLTFSRSQNLIPDEPLLSGQPLLSGRLPIPRGWPLNRGSTVTQLMDHNTGITLLFLRSVFFFNLLIECRMVWQKKVTQSSTLNPSGVGGGGVLSHTLTIPWYVLLARVGFQALEFRTGYINQKNNVGNRIYNYIKLINSLIQVAINFLERHNYRHVLNTQNSILSFNTGIRFRTGYQNQAKSSLEQVQVSVGPATHPHQIFCSVSPPQALNQARE